MTGQPNADNTSSVLGGNSNLAAAFASEARFGEAESLLRKALQIEPDNPDTRAFLSQVESQLGRPSDVHP